MLQKSDFIKYFQSSITKPEYKGIGTEHEKFIFHCENKKRIELLREFIKTSHLKSSKKRLKRYQK